MAKGNFLFYAQAWEFQFHPSINSSLMKLDRT